MAKPNEVEFAGAPLRRHRHVCAFFRDAEEEIKILLPFLREGLGRGEKVVYIIREQQRDDYLRRLEQGGLATAAAQRGGQLELRGLIHENPFYQPPEEFLKELRAREG